MLFFGNYGLVISSLEVDGALFGVKQVLYCEGRSLRWGYESNRLSFDKDSAIVRGHFCKYEGFVVFDLVTQIMARPSIPILVFM